MKYLAYGSQSIEKDDLKIVVKTLQSSHLTQGPKIDEFEHKLCEYTGAKYAVAVNSGTAALHCAYYALGLGSGDEVITSPMTFAATSNAALYLGAKPVFVDVDPQTGCIDSDLIESKITPKTKLITVIDYGGQPVNFKKINQIAKKHNLLVVDDACHALGATYQKQILGKGNQALATILSFHPVKHITTGEGGALLTNDKSVYDKAIQFRSHGITKDANKFKNDSPGPWYHEMHLLGFNYRIPDILAALGISQLKKMDTFLKRRRLIATQYDKAFRKNPYFDIPSKITDTQHAYHLYPILLKDHLVAHKSQLVKKLNERGIGTQVHYIPVYRHPYYQSLGYKLGTCPNAEAFYERELSIPMFPKLTDTDVKRVIRTILQTCKELTPTV